MNFTRKLAMVVTVGVIAALLIALLVMPAGAITKVPDLTSGGKVLNSPEVPALISYQGYLTDSDGVPMNGVLTMSFSIYDTETEGTAMWVETQDVVFSDGLFNVMLGNTTPLSPSFFEGSPRYLGITIAGEELTPRQQLASVPYAFQAENAETIDGMDSADFALAAHNHDSDYVNLGGDTMTGTLVLPADGLVAGTDQLVLTGGKVGIGTASPGDYKLEVQGGSINGIYADGITYGVYGSGSSSGTGVYGACSNGNYGQLGTIDYGVYSEHWSGNYGWLGAISEGVVGANLTYGNYGKLGTGSEGVYGENSTYGNYGKLGTSSEGVYGWYNSGNYGRLGTSTAGVVGTSISGTGVYGGSTNAVGIEGSGGTYDFYASGGGLNYGPFTGGHEVKLSGDFAQNIRPGLIVSVTGETQVRTDEGEITYSSTLATVQLSSTPNDSKVFGVITSESPLPEEHWYQAGEGERFGIVNALGEGRVWVANINGNIEAGDYITTSAIAGYGQKQDDDLLHSYTLGKAIETVDWSQVTETIDFDGQTYKIYPIAVVYTSG